MPFAFILAADCKQLGQVHMCFSIESVEQTRTRTYAYRKVILVFIVPIIGKSLLLKYITCHVVITDFKRNTNLITSTCINTGFSSIPYRKVYQNERQF